METSHLLMVSPHHCLLIFFKQNPLPLSLNGSWEKREIGVCSICHFMQLFHHWQNPYGQQLFLNHLCIPRAEHSEWHPSTVCKISMNGRETYWSLWIPHAYYNACLARITKYTKIMSHTERWGIINILSGEENDGGGIGGCAFYAYKYQRDLIQKDWHFPCGLEDMNRIRRGWKILNDRLSPSHVISA